MTRHDCCASRLTGSVVGFLALLALGATAHAQTLTLTDSSDTVLRGGSYANTNYGASATLATRAGAAEYERRILLKFDTHTTIAQGTGIASAQLTLTVRGGNAETRTLSVYRVPQPYTDTQATWNIRRSGYAWGSPGGDMAERVGQLTVTAAVGSRVSVDLTSVVQNIVNGSYGSSRYLRVLLVDMGAESRGSYKEFYSEDAGAGSGPTLTVGLGTVAAAPAPAGTTLKVVDWNIHHGVDTSNVNNLDRVATWIQRIGAHVASLNEVELQNGYNNNADEPAVLKSLMESKTGVTWYTCFAQRTGASRGQGNLILSRIRIEACDQYLLSSSRSVARATVTVNGRTINAFSTHLDDGSASYRTTQISQLKSYASGVSEQRIIMGDFNAWPGATEIQGMLSSYDDSWAQAKAEGTAIAYAGNEAGNTRNSRIDYVFRSKGAASLVLRAAQVYDTGSVSDHRPVSATFEVR